MALVVEEQIGLQRPRINVVIPAHNEAQNLAHVLPNFPSIVDEVILVDGASTDDTISIPQQFPPPIHPYYRAGA